MHALVKTSFARLYLVDPEEEERKLADSDSGTQEGEAKLTVSATMPEVTEQSSVQEADGSPLPPPVTAPEQSPLPSTPRAKCTFTLINNRDMRLYSTLDGLPSVLELLRVLINILDPTDQAHTDSTRLTALRILNVAFEVAGSRICEYPSLSALVFDTGCKFLFQLARSDNPPVLQTTLRTISTMFETMRPELKLQHELFLTFTIDRLAPPQSPKTQLMKAGVSPRPNTPVPGTPHLGPVGVDAELEKGPSTPRILVAPARGDTRELLLETLGLISRHPSFMVDLYTNYDCDMNCENMFEKLIDFATKVSCLVPTIMITNRVCGRGYTQCNTVTVRTCRLRPPNTSAWTCC